MDAADTNRHMERIYSTLPHQEIPWNRSAPPALLVELLDRGAVPPGRVLDIGCGMGNYSRYLAGRGFAATGVDASPSAIAAARRLAEESGVEANLLVADMTGDVSHLPGPFDFVFEWMVLHHILGPERQRYKLNLLGLLEAGGHYLSVSISEAHEGFGEPPTGKWRKSPLGPTIYCAALDELVDFFAPHCHILDQRLAQIPGSKAPHLVNSLFMQKK